MVLKSLDESGKAAMIQWFASPIRYFFKLLHDDTVQGILRKEQARKQAVKEKDV